LYVDARDLLKNLSTQRLQVLDCRSVNVFAGAARDSAHVRIQGRSIHFDGFRVGHIPGAKNVPYASVVNVEDEKLKRLFEEAGLDLTMPVAVVGTGGVDAASGARRAF
jgi:3-mercaptopyruvate sulfurtransferase SseA